MDYDGWPWPIDQDLGIDSVDLYVVDLDSTLIRSFPPNLLRKHGLIPLSRTGGILRVAVADPFKMPAFDELRGLTGLKIEPVLASESQIRRVLADYLGPDATQDA